ncbi:MAG: hypothetical protein K2G55_11605, partial [Lachnospiraceae bacterium]|nr:hypothetical protein [Lachnospiraceae bacterium]
ALGGAAIGAGAVAIGTAVSDSETGYNRSWGEYWERLITGSCIGFIAGAAVYGLIAAVPAAASAAGVQAGMMFGTSTFTAVTVPGIVTAGGYGLAAAGGIYTANDIYSNSRGYNVILDKIFDDDIEAYETAGMVLDLFTEMYTNLGESNRALGNRSSNAAEEAGEEPPKKSVNTSDNDGNGKDDELSMNLNKGEEDKTNKGFESIGKGGNGQEENIDKRASEEGIIIEHKNNEDSVSRDQQDFKTSQIQLETYEFNNDAPEKDRVLCVNQVNQSVVVDSNKVRTSATSPFRGGETEAGHSFQKHGGRHPETWGKVSGGPEQINNTAMQHIEDILNAPGDFVVTTIDNLKFLEKRLPDGRGLRLNMDGTFKGFID